MGQTFEQRIKAAQKQLEQTHKRLQQERQERKEMWGNLSLQQRIRLKQYYKTESEYWRIMMHRVYDPKHFQYSAWGAQGFSVCDEWRISEEVGVCNFIIDVGHMDPKDYYLEVVPNKLKLDRFSVRWFPRDRPKSGALTAQEEQEIRQMKGAEKRIYEHKHKDDYFGSPW